MKKGIIYLVVIFAISSISLNTYAQQTGTFTDSRDGHVYKTVKIGSKTWMAENLAYKSNESRVYDDDENNVAQYGRLYDYDAAKAACPTGWSLPELKDFEALLEDFGGEGNASYETLIESGTSGFSATLAGWRNGREFLDKNRDAYFWSHTFGGRADAWVLYLNSKSVYTKLYRNTYSSGFSVRCIKD